MTGIALPRDGTGLIKKTPLRFGRSSTIPRGFQSPEYFDNRGWHAATDNQGNQPACVAFAFLDCMEVRNWHLTGIKANLDAMPFYKECKRRDADGMAGTSFERAIEVGIDMKYLRKGTKYKFIKDAKEVFHAMHKNFVVLAGFDTHRGWLKANKVTGFIPSRTGYNRMGPHAVVINSGNLRHKNPDKDWIGLHNQWGADWGKDGHARMTIREYYETCCYCVYIDEPEM